jgi:2-(1,2-epoxy-1,2-dihydrophenyl)acetyl-CoA isomerase
MRDDSLLVNATDAVATLTLNRPQTKNALTRELVQALGDELTRLAEDRSVRAIVLTGTGGAFCSGADLKAAMVDPDSMATTGEALEGYHRVVRAIAATPQPVIAAVDGPAVGFGCDLALACDLRIVSSRAYLQEKFVRIGLMPDGGGSLWLPRMIGLGRALEIMMTGRKIEAHEATALGLANRVVEAELLEGEARKLATQLAKGPPLALAAIKRAARAGLDGGLEDALARERDSQLKLLQSADFMEGVQAWMQKRAPAFKGD